MATPAVPYAATFAAAAARYGVPLPILLGVAQHESNFNAGAVNHDANGTQDVGIMQLNLQAQQLSASQAGNPNFAIPYAAKLLAAHYQSAGSWTGALSEYNTGSATSPVGQAYAAAVLGIAKTFGLTNTSGTYSAKAAPSGSAAAASTGFAGALGLSSATFTEYARIALLALAGVALSIALLRL